MSDFSPQQGEEVEKMRNNNRKGVKPNRVQNVLIIATVVVVMIAGVAWAKNTFFSTRASQETQLASAADVSAAELNQVKADLTVDLDERLISSAFPEVSRELLDSSLPVKNRERVNSAGFSTALTFPFTGASQKDDQSYADEVVQGWWNQELTEELLRNPVYGAAVARALAESKFSDGSTLAEINPWLNEFIVKYDGFFVDGKLGNAEFLTVESSAEGAPLLVTDEYRRYAVGMRWLLDRFSEYKVKRFYSERHWGLRPANDLTPSMVRAEAFEGPEDRDAIVATLTSKNGKVMLVIGFNVHDKRPELPGKRPEPETVPETSPQETPTPETKKPPVETTTPTPETRRKKPPVETTPSPTKPVPETTPTPETTPSPTKPTPEPTKPTVPETTPTPTKSPSRDPEHNGGGQRGGSSNKIGEPFVEPTNPSDTPGQGHGDPAQVTQPAPTTAAEYKDVPVDNHNETRMNQETKPASTDTGRRDDTGQVEVIGNDNNAANQNNGYWKPED